MFLLLHTLNNIVICKKNQPAPPSPPFVKLLYPSQEKNKKYVEFDFRMGTFLVIFSFF